MNTGITSKSLTDDSRLWFGKHKGERLLDVPPKYWQWLREQPGFKFKYPSLWNWLQNQNDLMP